MVKVDTYTLSGKKTAAKTVLPAIFNEKLNLPLLSQAVRVYFDRKHKGLAKTKTRSEVSLTTKKIYRQKGTGGARHGAKSAPIFVGGGVAHGPKGVKRILKIPSRMKRKALNVALSYKAQSGKLVVAEGLSKIKKTSDAQEFITGIRSDYPKGSQKTSLVISDLGKDILRYFSNLKDVNVYYYKNINPYDIYYGGIVVIDQNVFSTDKEKTVKEIKTAKKEDLK